ESPYPPSPKVFDSMSSDEIAKLRLYPDPAGKRLREKVAKLYGVRPENIFLANGSDEALAFAFLAFCDDKHPAAFPDITYGFYPVYCRLFGAPYIQIPLREDFSIKCEDYYGISKTIVIANPNAPTGLMISQEEIEKILRTNPNNVVIIDEAYVDFGGTSVVSLIERYDNLLVVHTCSKSRSLAGARLSFTFGCEALISDIDRIRYSFNSYNVTRMTLTAGEAAIDDEAYYAEMREKIVRTRNRTAAGLKALGFVMTDSKANFLFARHPGISGRDLYRKLKAMGILVRHFDKPRITDYLRITIGTETQMDALIEAIKKILKEA
ncbi:MAG: histidinol-phosphate transaminase, partial [Clostridiales bacterium]|nr:histidinol-phosphate transaminase [Clostridiales bacterium]